MEAPQEPASGSAATCPPELLTRALALVPQADRLGSCALVCSGWKPAAVAASGSVSISSCSQGQQQKLAALSLWLQRHAAAVPVTALDVSGSGTQPWPQLRLPWAQLSGLRELRMRGVSVVSGDPPAPATAAPSAATGSALPQLTKLSLQRCGMDDAGVALVSGLSGLLELDLHACTCTQAAVDAPLPESLTRLHVRGTQQAVELGDHVAHLSALQRLELDGDVQPLEALSGLGQLNQLKLNCIIEGAEAESSSLTVLAGLSQLCSLEVGDDCSGRSPLAPQSAYAACAALTASSQLTHLGLLGLNLPPGASSAMFPAGRQLPQLVVVQAGPELCERPEDTARLVRACPRLQRVALMQPADEGYSPVSLGLQSLAQLTCLELSRVDLADTCYADLAATTSLRHLKVHSFDTGLPGVLQLTALTALTSLCVEYFCDTAGDQVTLLELSNQAAPGCAPDVWQRIPEDAGECLPWVSTEDNRDGVPQAWAAALVAAQRNVNAAVAAAHAAELRVLREQVQAEAAERRRLQALLDVRERQ